MARSGVGDPAEDRERPAQELALLGVEQAAVVVARLGAGVVVPMHFRTERIDILEPVDAFADRAERVERLSSPVFELEALPAGDGPLVVVPAAP